ncbi:ParB/RepB/Spo0J family partition protein [Pseudonocardia abyssalis]|uniref:ParB N-terminal domain-containing protein n=1 Tax=Pseudonocardia abyssalis TaxID=2792008 RepID=A0ABS6URU0_9PSEU|nr:ParB N-terminal domain-containing protein [Pseudonocardia abyssalis]MBW0117228.1 ParB N-terminal domain-containing protein [Pseudonocardia abyssalis]MBW0134974.1 ParB N-terminal domain-containing protein [Pseudonocardia abyssalis]
MTITDTRPTTPDNDPDRTPPPEASTDTWGELLVVDPTALVIGANVRREVALDKSFLRSIADRGVREPITVRRRADGGLVVRKGKRRTLAAVETGRPSVPVLIEPGTPDDDPDTDAAGTEGRIERIVDQLEENQHRTGTSEADEVRAHQQLLDLGLTAGQIARRTHVPTARVKATAAVARSKLAAAVLDRYEVTLDQVAVIAEFDDGTDAGVEAAKVLTVTAAKEPAQFEHVAQRLRDDRTDTALVAEQVAELTTAGVSILDSDAAGGALQISGLRANADLPSGTELTAEQHASCPGQAAQVEIRRGWDRQPQVRVTHWCTDPETHGHIARWDQLTAHTGGSRSGAMSEEEKAQRRLVIANNREWDSATTVRRDWLRGFLARRTAPKDAVTYMAVTLARGGHDLRRAMESGHPSACELLGMAPVGSVYTGRANPITDAAATAATPRATVLALAVLLGSAEDATDRQTWRNPTSDHRAYFTTLSRWGYPLSTVEQLVLTDPERPRPDDPTPDADSDSAGGDELAEPETLTTD